MTTLLTVGDIRRIVARAGLDAIMDEMIERLTTAFRDFDPERTDVAVREGFTYERPHVGLLEAMSVLEIGERATVKMVGYHPENPKTFGLPTILSSVQVFDARTGHLVGLVDGTYLTALRTAAASAVASRALAIPRARTLGLIGCGAQAVTQLHALGRIFDLDEVLVYDSDPERSAGFASRTQRFASGSTAIRRAPLAEVVSATDILCTQTSVGVGEGPVFEDRETRPHLHVNAVGSDFPNKTELPLSFLERSFVCPDFPEQTKLEGECQRLSPDRVGASIVDVLKSEERYRHVQERTTVFDSTGFALEDQVAAELLFRHARELGLGTSLAIECSAADPWDPYGFLDA